VEHRRKQRYKFAARATPEPGKFIAGIGFDRAISGTTSASALRDVQIASGDTQGEMSGRTCCAQAPYPVSDLAGAAHRRMIGPSPHHSACPIWDITLPAADSHVPLLRVGEEAEAFPLRDGLRHYAERRRELAAGDEILRNSRAADSGVTPLSLASFYGYFWIAAEARALR
jgi:hypothetical protein